MQLQMWTSQTQIKKRNKVAGNHPSTSVGVFYDMKGVRKRQRKNWGCPYRAYSAETVGLTHGYRERASASIPLHFVCKRLEVLNQLALLRWRGGGPVSDGQEAMETKLVTCPAAGAAAANKLSKAFSMHDR